MFRFMTAYKEGASIHDVIACTKALKKRHRVPLVLEKNLRPYNRYRFTEETEETEVTVEREESVEKVETEEDQSTIEFTSIDFGKRMRQKMTQDFKNKNKGLIRHLGHLGQYVTTAPTVTRDIFMSQLYDPYTRHMEDIMWEEGGLIYVTE